ncbi:protein CHUP1, chloroplastic-like [Hordeum vulgare]|uniref:protein CHUP1, chloroplastic-like n=1 Tax=Hordeum vulgare subsp. vulgare TaxID=112509 RepID=UPI000B467642|nr:protein CHUP1, chloroplastic-like [Hordeum vulgare subsp. vulgare]KAE8800393.1 protein CHUP1, chloroplastic-like [Hordeum vulgare]
MGSKQAEDIKNLLLKIIIPLAFPLAGSFICGLIADRAIRHSGLDSSDNSIQLDQSSSDGLRLIQEEEAGGEMESPTPAASRKLVQAETPYSTGRLVGGGHARQASLTEEIKVAQDTESSSEVSVNNQRFQDAQGTSPAGTEEVESLKRVVSALEERAAGIESRFQGYCDMKEQESTYQKMQIMCLGMKLEVLESQNQRLEAAATEIRAAAEEFAVMRASLDALQSKFRKVAKKSKQEFDAIDGRILALDAREAEMATRCQGFEQLMAEMKELVSQLQKGKGTDSESVEVAVERSMRKLSSSKDLLDGMEVLRDRWAADMEELIYLGWITAWLQHDLLVGDGEGGTAKGTVVIGDDDNGTSPTAEGQPKKGEKMVVAAAPINEVELRKTSSNASSCGGAGEESCMGLAGCSRAGIGRPRLLRKIRGWTRGKGPSKQEQ